MRSLWLSALALTILLPLLAVTLALSAVSASQAQCASGLLATGGPVGGVPQADAAIFQGAAAQYGLGDRGPSILAAINYIESTFGTSTLPGVHSGTNSAGAAGPMQIGIDGTAGDTWDRIKVSAPGDPPGQPPNVYDEADAVYSAANYLHNSGAPGDWPSAIFTYNHSSAYVQQVLSLAAAYYTQGLTAQGSASSPTTTSSVTTGSPFTVPPASADPAGPITLAQGQPTIVAATLFTDHTGAWGDDLTVSTDSYAELSPGLPRSHVSKQNATMLGGLPYLTPLQVTNPQNGRSVVLYKRDIGTGQPLSSTLDGYHYRIDLTAWAEQQLGLSGSALVQVTRLDGPTNGPGGGQACSSANQVTVAERVPMTGRVGHQVPDRGLASRGSQAGPVAVEALKDLQLAERRQHRRDLLLELETPLLDQLERRDARERLGHRHQPEHGVRVDRGGTVHSQPPGLCLLHLTVPVGRDGDRAWHAVVGDRLIQQPLHTARPAHHRHLLDPREITTRLTRHSLDFGLCTDISATTTPTDTLQLNPRPGQPVVMGAEVLPDQSSRVRNRPFELPGPHGRRTQAQAAICQRLPMRTTD